MESREIMNNLKYGKKKTILILEDLPSLNKGEMTIMGGILQSFANLGPVEVFMLTDRPDINDLRYGKHVKSIDIKEIFPIKKNLAGVYQIVASVYAIILHVLFIILYKTIGKSSLKVMNAELWNKYIESDVFFVGHDGTFGPGGGEGVPLYFYPFYVSLFGKLLNKPVVMYGGGMPEFKKYKSILELISKHVLNMFDLIILREDISYEYLKSINVNNKNSFVLPDPAFLLKEINPQDARKILIDEGIISRNSPLVGLTVTRRRALMAFPDLDSEESYLRHNTIIANVIDYLVCEMSAYVIFVPHCIGFGDELDDRIVAQDILKIVKNKDKVKVITNEYKPEELKGLIGQFDLFIGERLHSVVNAISMTVPSIIITNSSDQRLGIIKMAHQNDSILYIEDINENDIIKKVDEVWSNKEKIRTSLETEMKWIQNKAMVSGCLLKKILY